MRMKYKKGLTKWEEGYIRKKTREREERRESKKPFCLTAERSTAIRRIRQSMRCERCLWRGVAATTPTFAVSALATANLVEQVSDVHARESGEAQASCKKRRVVGMVHN